MSLDVNILVNGSRCKQYHHDGKIFIEAKDGSEYTIEIKNNDWKRVLAVCSVDGLDILNGKKAKENNPGYVISGYNTGKFDGFRVSNEKIAKFVFGSKGGSYAASKEDGSEKNVGVIGVRIFSEKEKPAPPAPIVIREEHHHHHDHWPKVDPWKPYGPYWGSSTPLWCDTTWKTMCDSTTYGSTVSDSSPSAPNNSETYSSTKLSYKGSSGLSSKGLGRAGGQSAGGQSALRSANMSKLMNASSPNPRGFDMGTKWGQAKESRVVEVDFERGTLVLSKEIYYASRESLLEMGVPLGNEKQVSFPEAFTDSKYAKPPKNWQG